MDNCQATLAATLNVSVDEFDVDGVALKTPVMPAGGFKSASATAPMKYCARCRRSRWRRPWVMVRLPALRLARNQRPSR